MRQPASRRLPDGRHLHVLTPEYPPEVGGVSDYVTTACAEIRDLGHGLTIWCPAVTSGPRESSRGLRIEEVAGGYEWAGLRELNRRLKASMAPRRLLVQWVPHGFGYRSLNVLFCLWVWWRSICGDTVEIVLHEPFLRFGERGWKQDAAALIHRLMTIILLQATRQVWMVTPEWERLWRPYALGRRVEFSWMPLTCSVPVTATRADGEAMRASLGIGDRVLLGHFGTFNHEFSEVLMKLIPELLKEHENYQLLLIGKRSDTFRLELLKAAPHLENQVLAAGMVSPEELSRYLMACDVMVQPYPDGVNARRSSLIVCLVHGVPTVATDGSSTEEFWRKCDGVRLAPAGDTASYIRAVAQVADDAGVRRELGQKASEFSKRVFGAQVGSRIFLGLERPVQ